MNLATGSSELSAEEFILIPNGVREETVLINVSFSIRYLKYHWMLIPTAPIWGLKVVTRYEGVSINNQPIPFPMDRDGHDFHALFQYMFYTWVQNCTRIESFFNKIFECQTWVVMQRHAFHLKLSTVL